MGIEQKINISCVLWSFNITVKDDIIINCDSNPNNRNHWVVGNSFAWLKNYYSVASDKVKIEFKAIHTE